MRSGPGGSARPTTNAPASSARCCLLVLDNAGSEAQVYAGGPHGITDTRLNQDLLAFLNSYAA